MEKTICIFNEQRSGELICTDFVYETSNIQESAVHHESYVLGVVEKSEGVLMIEGKEHPLVPGDVFFIPENIPYRLRFFGEIAYYYIVFYGRRVSELLSRVSPSHTAAVFGAREEYKDYDYAILNDNEFITFKYFDKIQNDNSAFWDKNRKNWLHILSDDYQENYNRTSVYPEIAEKMNGILKSIQNGINENRRGIIE